jgi:dienelactone hydrolase
MTNGKLLPTGQSNSKNALGRTSTDPVLTPASHSKNFLVLASACLLTIGTAGWTSRWTLTFPMVPLLALQFLRRLSSIEDGPRGIKGAFTALSCLLLFMGVSLSILFPAVELPPFEGPYNVGVVDFYMRVEFATDSVGETCKAHSDLPVRLLYPTRDEPESIPYLSPYTAYDFCRQNMKNAAPPPLQDFDWILHTWRLTSVRAKRNASLLQGKDRLPIVLFSHGLLGTAEVYSYQAMSLAANGNVVLQVNHQDGSAPVVRLSNGTTMLYDLTVRKLWSDGRELEYANERRSRTDFRAQEIVAATEALHKLDRQDSPVLMETSGGLSFLSRLAIGETVFMGHSFGGATALTAAMRRPDLVQSIVAHDPAVDWMPDDARRSLFPKDRLVGLENGFSGGTGGFGICENHDVCHSSNASLHDKDMLLLFSNEWYNKDLAGSQALASMHVLRRVGVSSGVSLVGFVDRSHHTDFSDTNMLNPLWLSRAVGLTGKRNPCDTAKEIRERTQAFLDTVAERNIDNRRDMQDNS